MRALVFHCIACITFAASMKAEEPFDFATTPGKLPKQVVPTDYEIRIVPNIEKLTFTGMETVKLSVRAAVRKLVLNAILWTAKVEVPSDGVRSSVTEEELKQNLDAKKK